MQPARIKPHAKEHTNNPVQRPNFRGHGAGDVEVTRARGKAPPLPIGSKEPIARRMTPPTGAENHGADTLRGRGVRMCKHPRARYDELQCAGLQTLQATCGVPKMTKCRVERKRPGC
jgi:hypothetical protein